MARAALKKLRLIRSQTLCDVRGLSLIEILIVLAIVGFLGTVATTGLRSLWQSQLINANLNVIRNWLETTRRAALRGESCTITVNNGTFSDGAVVITSQNPSAESFNASCNDPDSLQLDSPGKNRTYTFRASSSGSTVSTFSFTPRGTIYKSSDTDPTFAEDIIISLSLSAETGTATSDSYCFRISPLMGNMSQPSKANC